ncbi:MAG: ribonuclease P protein component [Candidatus Pacebacteria bacterium]|nr:ribonuclease P protein component [Candidatus Paceibacterota bacterium]HJL55829.1 ribonuclease P protein component [Candidatus Paceibacterota bacterium]
MENKTVKELFSEVLKKGKSYHSPHVSFKMLHMPSIGKSSFYFVVSGKVIKKAVKRNLFKRRGRSIAKSSGVKPGYVGAFFAKKGAGTLEYDKFKTEVLDLLQKAKLLAK